MRLKHTQTNSRMHANKQTNAHGSIFIFCMMRHLHRRMSRWTGGGLVILAERLSTELSPPHPWLRSARAERDPLRRARPMIGRASQQTYTQPSTRGRVGERASEIVSEKRVQDSDRARGRVREGERERGRHIHVGKRRFDGPWRHLEGSRGRGVFHFDNYIFWLDMIRVE